MIMNVNDTYGMPLLFTDVEHMERALQECGHVIPSDGLQEGRDYEVFNTRGGVEGHAYAV